jgi:hypothetical protein
MEGARMYPYDEWLAKSARLTEHEWLTTRDPRQLLFFLWYSHQWDTRRARLFSIACCRMIEEYLKPVCRAAIPIIERWVDGQATDDERAAAERQVAEVYNSLRAALPGEAGFSSPEMMATECVLGLCASIEEEARWSHCNQFVAEQVVTGVLIVTAQNVPAEELFEAIQSAKEIELCERIRDFFGNPFAAANG